MTYRADPDRQLLEFRVSRHEIMASALTGKIALTKPAPAPSGARCVMKVGREVYDLTELTNDAMGILNWRPAPQALLRHTLHAPSGRSSSRVHASPHIPRTRRRKMPAADGRTTFHFDHTAISIVHPSTVAARGAVTQSASAVVAIGKAHNIYLEREGAVAIDASPALASERQLLGIELEPAGENGDNYIARDSAVARQPDGTKMLFTNINDNSAIRQEFWNAVARTARQAQPDRLEIRYAPHKDYWDEVRADPACPGELRTAIDAAAKDGIATTTTGSNEPLRSWMHNSGRPKWKTGAYAKSGRDTKGTTDPGVWRDGRGGRVQFRIIGELPKELSMEGRKKAVLELCKEFEKRRLPFVAVIHAPDYDNHPDNWHYHIIYHDRPATMLWNGVWDFEQTGPLKKHEGDEEDMEPLSWGEGKTCKTFPYRQPKNADVRRNDWPQYLRECAARCVNEQLMQEKRSRLRYHPGKGDDIGQVNRGQEKLGSKMNAIELVGGVTAVGIANEERENNAFVGQIIREFHQRQNHERVRHAEVVKQLPHGIALANIQAKLDQSHRERLESACSERDAKLLQNSLERVLSGPEQLHSNMIRHFSAVCDGKAKKRDRERKGEFAIRFAQADEALSDLANFKVAQELLIADLMMDSRKRTERAAQLERDVKHEIEKRLGLPQRIAVQPVVRVPGPVITKENTPAVVPSTHAKAREPDRLPTVLLDWCDDIILTPRILTRRADGVVVPIKLRQEDEPILRSADHPYSMMTAKLDRFLAIQTKEADEAVAALTSDGIVTQVSSSGNRGWIVESQDDELTELIVRISEHPRVEAALRQRCPADPAHQAPPNAPAAEADLTPPEFVPLIVEKAETSPIAKAAVEPTDQGQSPLTPILIEPIRPDESERRQDLRMHASVLPPREMVPPIRATETPAVRPAEPVATSNPQPDGAKKPVAPAFNLAMREIDEHGFKLVKLASGISLHKDDMRALELTHEIIAHPVAQQRLAAFLPVQQRMENRILAFAKSYPTKLIVRGNHVRLAENAPGELQSIMDRMGANGYLHEALIDVRWRHDQQIARGSNPSQQHPGRSDVAPSVPDDPIERETSEQRRRDWLHAQGMGGGIA